MYIRVKSIHKGITNLEGCKEYKDKSTFIDSFQVVYCLFFFRRYETKLFCERTKLHPYSLNIAELGISS